MRPVLLTFNLVEAPDASGRIRRLAEPRLDGRTVREWVSGANSARSGNVSLLGGWDARYVRAQVEHLLGDGPPVTADGRAPVLVCPTCGDHWCGTHSVLVSVVGDQLHWDDLRVTWGDPTDPANTTRGDGPSFVLDRAQARAAFEAAVAEVYGLPLAGLPREVVGTPSLPL